MILKIAWKNIWRTPVRSIVVIASVVVGIWVGLFLNAFNWGMYQQRIDEVVNKEVGHIQIHDSLFLEDYQTKFDIPNAAEIIQFLDTSKLIKNYSSRIIVSGLVQSSALRNQPVRLVGVDFEKENDLIDFKKGVVEEDVFQSSKRRIHAYVGQSLLDTLKSGLNKKLNFKSIFNSVEVSVPIRARGVYKLSNRLKESSEIFVDRDDLIRVTTMNHPHEIAIILNDYERLDEITELLQKKFPQNDVQSWKGIVPELSNAIEVYDVVMSILIFIILIGLALGIVNTMLMAILERTQELGMLKAIGMASKKIFMMIMLETLLLTSFGVPIGILFNELLVMHFHEAGIDLSAFADSIEQFGYSTMVYPEMNQSFYLIVVVEVVIVSFLSSIIPALRALSLNPVNAIRKI